MPDKKQTVKQRQRQAAAKNRSMRGGLRSGRTPARPKASLKEVAKQIGVGAREEMELIKEAGKALGKALVGPTSKTGRGAAYMADPILVMPKKVKPKRKRK